MHTFSLIGLRRKTSLESQLTLENSRFSGLQLQIAHLSLVLPTLSPAPIHIISCCAVASGVFVQAFLPVFLNVFCSIDYTAGLLSKTSNFAVGLALPHADLTAIYTKLRYSSRFLSFLSIFCEIDEVTLRHPVHTKYPYSTTMDYVRELEVVLLIQLIRCWYM